MICRSCESSQLSSIYSFGHLPLANRLLKFEQLKEKEPRYNLEIMLCRNCSLVQLKDTVEPKELFDDYLYFSSNADTMLQSAAILVEQIIPTLSKGATIIEIASNDGYLLKNYLHKEFSVLGIEPAQNIAKYANTNNIPTRADYFTYNLSETLKSEGFSADIIHANNVLAHVPAINDFVSGIRNLLKPNGRVILEVPYLLDLISANAFDTIYHEHIYYFSLLALNSLFRRHGLQIYDIEKLTIHGGSLRLFVAHAGKYPLSDKLLMLLDKETELKINEEFFYQNFINQIFQLKEQLKNQLELFKKANKKMAAYGASAKGTTLLNFFGLGKELIDFVVDRSTVKQGYYTPGTHLEIQSPKALIKEQIDYALLLTWNFTDEILKQQALFRDRGGKFIVPIPQLEVI